MCADPADPAPPPPPAWARRKLVCGGGLLAVTFFLPMLGGCFQISPLNIVRDSPAEWLNEMSEPERTADPEAWNWHLRHVYMTAWSFAAPHLLGLLVALAALLVWRMRLSLATRLLAVATAASAALVTLLPSLIYLTYDVKSPYANAWQIHEEAFPVLVASWCVVAYLLLSAKHARSPAEQTGWLAVAGAIPTAAWLVFLASIDDGLLLGFYLAAAGTLLLFTGGIWIVRACRRAATTR
ncbi:MAG: hypothetical protein HS116_27075 [Planctomycetes bacterium]|nr:hypothetical protein [Planctomycetota bacterium]